jgi:hypothetical protein
MINLIQNLIQTLKKLYQKYTLIAGFTAGILFMALIQGIDYATLRLTFIYTVILLVLVLVFTIPDFMLRIYKIKPQKKTEKKKPKKKATK